MQVVVQAQVPSRNWLVLVMAAGSIQPADGAEGSKFKVEYAVSPRQHRVLVVDDEPEMLLLTRLFLEQAFPGIHVVTAATGPEALRFLERSSYDAVVSDYRMPKMDGLEFLKQAAARVPADRRILMSAYVDPMLHQRARQAGLAFIEKGGDPQNIVDAVGRALGP